MRSARPKPLHLMCGRPMVMHVIHALADVDIDRTVVVVGHGAERVTKKVQEQAPDWAHVTFVEQTVQRGTGDAAMVGMTAIPGDDLDDDSTIIVLPGDTPLLRADTLHQLVATHLSSGNAATAITSVLDDPTGYGRVLRAPSKHGDGRVLQVDRTTRCLARRSSPSARCGPACARSAATCSARRCAGSAPTTSKASTTSPMSSRSLAGDGSPDRHRAGARGRDARRQRSMAAGSRRARAAQPHEPPLAAQRRDDARSARRRSSMSPCSSAATSPCIPGTILQGNTIDRRRLRDRPRHPARRLRRSAPGPWSRTASVATARSATTPGRPVRRTSQPGARCLLRRRPVPFYTAPAD